MTCSTVGANVEPIGSLFAEIAGQRGTSLGRTSARDMLRAYLLLQLASLALLETLPVLLADPSSPGMIPESTRSPAAWFAFPPRVVEGLCEEQQRTVSTYLLRLE